MVPKMNYNIFSRTYFGVAGNNKNKKGEGKV
jgi:hypothetical protein